MRTMWFAQTATTQRNWVVAGLCGIAIAATAQTSPQPGSRLPPTAPTSISNQNSLPAPIAASPIAADTLPHHRAHVTYSDGLLQIHADNSSLNQILRDISRETGMKIVGGVADLRVFGSYGPATAGTVLQTLLDGTNTNMLLQETPTHAPVQLVLSPRTGGAAPPGPSSASYDVTENEPEIDLPGQQPSTARPVAGGSAPPPAMGAPGAAPAQANPAQLQNQLLGNVYGNPNNVSPTPSTLPTVNSVPISTLGTPSTAQPVSGIVSAPNPPPAGSTTAGFLNQTPPSANPNTAPTATSNPTPATGTKTPQQIYQELKNLQQQGGNPQANPQGSSAPQ